MVNVIGLGYIGLPTALMLAANGTDVVGTDIVSSKVERLRSGEMTFEEKGLDEIFASALACGITFSTSAVSADIYIISVQTPYDALTKQVDMSYVTAAVDAVLQLAPKGAVIVIESTVSPGAIDRTLRPHMEAKGLAIGSDIHLAHAPERVIPGNMVYELLHNDRTLGVDDPEIGEKLRKLYASFCRGNIVVTDIRTAEMTKVIENTFRCVNIAFANELSMICRSQGLDVYEVIRICNMHPRVNILQPGPGVGGHCIPIDPWFLVGDAPELTPLIRRSLEINEAMPGRVLERIRALAKENGIADLSRVGLYGLTFKENVDDCRESPALQLLRLEPLPFRVYDPHVAADLVPNQLHDLDAFLREVDLVVLMVKHSEIIENMDRLKDKIVLDCHNICRLENSYRL